MGVVAGRCAEEDVCEDLQGKSYIVNNTKFRQGEEAGRQTIDTNEASMEVLPYSLFVTLMLQDSRSIFTVLGLDLYSQALT